MTRWYDAMRSDDPRYHTARWQKLRAQAIARDKSCLKCGSTERLHADHIIEIEDGGTFFDLNNLQTLCKVDHDAKSAVVRAGRGV